ANGIPFGGIDLESSFEPGRIGGGSNNGLRLRPGMFFGQGGLPVFGVNTPLPHSAPNGAHSPFYKDPALLPNPVGFLGDPALLDGNYNQFNFAAFTPALPPADRQVYYGSFVRDICDK